MPVRLFPEVRGNPVGDYRLEPSTRLGGAGCKENHTHFYMAPPMIYQGVPYPGYQLAMMGYGPPHPALHQFNEQSQPSQCK